MSLTVTLTMPSLLDKLEEVFQSFQDWDDPLSRQLFEWGAGVVSIEPDSVRDRESFREVARRHLEELVTEILVDPMTGRPLQEPVLDRKYVWERWVLDDYLQHSSESPRDGQPIEVRAHEFASAMLKWVHSIRGTASVLRLTLYSPSSASRWSSDPGNAQALMAYGEMAKRANSLERMRSHTRQFEHQRRELRAFKQEMIAQIQVDRDEMKQEITEREEAITGRLEDLSATHRTHAELQQSRLDGQEETLGRTAQDLRHERVTVAAQLIQMQSLKHSYDEAMEQVWDLEDQVGDCSIL